MLAVTTSDDFGIPCPYAICISFFVLVAVIVECFHKFIFVDIEPNAMNRFHKQFVLFPRDVFYDVICYYLYRAIPHLHSFPHLASRTVLSLSHARMEANVPHKNVILFLALRF
jgi:hypothetical protein